MSVSTIELRRIAPFAALPPATLGAVASLAGLRTCRRGERLFRAGDPCGSMFVVLDGFVRLARPLPNGIEATVGVAGPGRLLGAAVLLGRSSHDSSTEALGIVRAVELPMPVFLSEGAHQLLAPLATLLLARLDAAWSDAAGDLQGTVGCRLLRVLRRFARPVRGSGHGSENRMARLAVRLSHAELARLVGAERATVSRELRNLAMRGAVELERGHVVGVATAAPGAWQA